MERFARLTFLARANAGRRRLRGFLEHLSHQLGREITPADVLPLERADTLRQIIEPLCAASFHQRPPAFSAWSPDAMTTLAQHLTSFIRDVGSPTVLLLPRPRLGIGPVRIAADAIASHIRVLAEGETEECVLVTEDGLAGIALYYHAGDHEHGEPTPYELLIWGETWRTAAVSHLPFDRASNAT
jgi:hypothetical protein